MKGQAGSGMRVPSCYFLRGTVSSLEYCLPRPELSCGISMFLRFSFPSYRTGKEGSLGAFGHVGRLLSCSRSFRLLFRLDELGCLSEDSLAVDCPPVLTFHWLGLRHEPPPRVEEDESRRSRVQQHPRAFSFVTAKGGRADFGLSAIRALLKVLIKGRKRAEA